MDLERGPSEKESSPQKGSKEKGGLLRWDGSREEEILVTKGFTGRKNCSLGLMYSRIPECSHPFSVATSLLW